MQFEFSKFLNISFFKKKNSNVMQQNADTFLANESLNIYHSLVRSGYNPIQEQSNTFNNILKSWFIDSQKKHSDIIKLLNSGYIFNAVNCVDFIQNYKADFCTNILDVIIKDKISLEESIQKVVGWSHQNNQTLYNHVLSIYKQPEIQSKLLESFLTLINKYSRYKSPLHFDKYIDIIASYNYLLPETFKNIPINDYISINGKINILKDKINSYRDSTFKQRQKILNLSKKNKSVHIDFLDNSLSNINIDLTNNFEITYSQHINYLINKTKIDYLAFHATQIAMEQHSKQTKNNFNIDLLPEKSIETIDIIKELYASILTSTKEEHLTTATSIINETLPEAIKLYLSMLPENRLTMVNSQGKNPEQILSESLDSIHHLLTSEFEKLQRDNLTVQSVHNRTLKANTI